LGKGLTLHIIINLKNTHLPQDKRVFFYTEFEVFKLSYGINM